MPRDYQVITTEFWRVSYVITAEDAKDALNTFDVMSTLSVLPEPHRKCYGVIDPPERVLGPTGMVVIDNSPPGDDAERMLFIEMFRRMHEHGLSMFEPLDAGVKFICGIKKWNPEEIWKGIRK